MRADWSVKALAVYFVNMLIIQMTTITVNHRVLYSVFILIMWSDLPGSSILSCSHQIIVIAALIRVHHLAVCDLNANSSDDKHFFIKWFQISLQMQFIFLKLTSPFVTHGLNIEPRWDDNYKRDVRLLFCLQFFSPNSRADNFDYLNKSLLASLYQLSATKAWSSVLNAISGLSDWLCKWFTSQKRAINCCHYKCEAKTLAKPIYLRLEHLSPLWVLYMKHHH